MTGEDPRIYARLSALEYVVRAVTSHVILTTTQEPQVVVDWMIDRGLDQIDQAFASTRAEGTLADDVLNTSHEAFVVALGTLLGHVKGDVERAVAEVAHKASIHRSEN